MLKETLANIIAGQSFEPPSLLLTRDIAIPQTSLISIITGIRRCGKSTLLKQMLQKEKQKAFINFEDPRLASFGLDDFEKMEAIFLAQGAEAFYLDEIQNVPEWEKYIRGAHDRGIKVFLTGSNASLLSKELGTKLTGRYLQTELFPFSYKEFLQFLKLEPSPTSLTGYLKHGGFPHYLKEQATDYLRTLFRDIIIRDIVVRRGLRNEKTILQLATFLLTNIGKPISFSKITQAMEIKSVRTTIDYCDYLQETYLLELVPKHSFSLKKEIANPKKIYCIDNGLVAANSLSFSEDRGRNLENLVYSHLRRSYDGIYYHQEKGECDFLVKEGGAITHAFQVCWQVTNENLKREIRGLQDALSIHKNAKGFIITFDQEDQVENIRLVPAWKWLNQEG